MPAAVRLSTPTSTEGYQLHSMASSWLSACSLRRRGDLCRRRRRRRARYGRTAMDGRQVVGYVRQKTPIHGLCLGHIHRTGVLLYAADDATIRVVTAIGKIDVSYCPLYDAGIAHDDLETFYLARTGVSRQIRRCGFALSV